MTTAIASDDAPRRRYVALLLRLHSIVATGQGDAKEADDIRDQMDEPWAALSPVDVALVRSLSADLYTLEQCVGRPADPDWESLLADLRQRVLPASQVAPLRGLAWNKVVGPEAGLPFFEYAAYLLLATHVGTRVAPKARPGRPRFPALWVEAQL